MAIWLKDLAAKQPGAYTIPQINTIPTGVSGVSVVSALLAGSLCMVYPLWAVFSIVQAFNIVANVSLLVWNIPKGYHFTCYYLLGVSAAVNPILLPFMNMALRDDAEARAITMGGLLTFGWAVYSFYPILVFPILEGPRWTKGYSVTVAFIIGCWASFLVMQYLYKKSENKKQAMMVREVAKDHEDLAGVDGKGGAGVPLGVVAEVRTGRGEMGVE
jgi:hypothetical protein